MCASWRSSQPVGPLKELWQIAYPLAFGDLVPQIGGGFLTSLGQAVADGLANDGGQQTGNGSPPTGVPGVNP